MPCSLLQAPVLTVASCSACLQIVSKVGGGLKPTGAEGKPGLEVAYEDDHMACIIKPQVGGGVRGLELSHCRACA